MHQEIPHGEGSLTMSFLPFLVIVGIASFFAWLLYAIFQNTADTIKEHRRPTNDEKMKVFAESLAEQRLFEENEGLAVTEEEEEEEEEE